MSVEWLDWDDFHPVGDVVSLFFLGSDFHKTAFGEDLASGVIQPPLLQWDTAAPPASKASFCPFDYKCQK